MNDPEIAWPELIRGTLVRRYKRFLADIILENGEKITAHCPNTGSMKECSQADQNRKSKPDGNKTVNKCTVYEGLKRI